MLAMLVSVLVVGAGLPSIAMMPRVQPMEDCLEAEADLALPVNSTGTFESFAICYPLDADALDALRRSVEVIALDPPATLDSSPPVELIQALIAASLPATIGADARPLLGTWRLPSSENAVGFACGPIFRRGTAVDPSLHQSWRSLLLRLDGVLTFVLVQPYFMTFRELRSDGCE